MDQASPSLLDTLGLDAFEPAEQDELLLTLSDVVLQGALVRILERVDDKTKEDLVALCDKDASPEEVETFLKTRVPTASDAVRETLGDIVSDLAALDIPAAA